MTLLVCDIAGTTINEDGIVYRQLRACVEEQGATVTADQVNEVKGTEKRNAIITLLSADGSTPSTETVDRAHAAFLEGLQREYAATPPRPIAGVEEVLQRFQQAGGKVALTTGFQRSIADIVLQAAGWGVRGSSSAPGLIVDALVTSDTVPAGRPAPYLIHNAMQLTETDSVAHVISVGDTVADLRAAANAGVRGIGVLTGSVSRETLEAEPHALVLDSLADLPDQRSLNVPEFS
ncbi:haloacid dehalogenase [Corynebacterium falsenii DSM 44353]|uniref:HAD hydrolase-like protein n=1 Tax=Corynebacterium falsenii TaxID=108486 RepID=UPI0003E94AF2|nr:HAD hydrolase-like protein [Corynebacterium falsenii]AHI03722.1 haloacid dehalogenase [Corynebacterium falsenii DSM 44353]UBI04451.1 HAD hydrolase-like protein [Corynebacterium falsenii]